MTTPTTLEAVLHDLAKRGELSHISLTPSQNGKLFRASFAMTSKFGISFAEDVDPAQAIIKACTSAKMKARTAIKVDGRLKESVDSIPQPVIEVENEGVEDLM